MWFKIYGHFFFLQNLLKLWCYFRKNTNVIAKMIPRNKFWYGTGYLLILSIFQSLTNHDKDFTNGVPMDPQPIKPKKSPTLVRLNFECQLKLFTWFALHYKWLDQYLYDTSFYWKVFPNRLYIVKSRGLLSFTYQTYQADNYMLKVNSKNASIRCGICAKLTIKVPKQRWFCRSSIFIVNFQNILHLVLVFLF